MEEPIQLTENEFESLINEWSDAYDITPDEFLEHANEFLYYINRELQRKYGETVSTLTIKLPKMVKQKFVKACKKSGYTPEKELRIAILTYLAFRLDKDELKEIKSAMKGEEK